MLGGTLTQVTLGGICGAWTGTAHTQVVHGLFDEFVHAMRKAQACDGLYSYGHVTAFALTSRSGAIPAGSTPAAQRDDFLPFRGCSRSTWKASGSRAFTWPAWKARSPLRRARMSTRPATLSLAGLCATPLAPRRERHRAGGIVDVPRHRGRRGPRVRDVRTEIRLAIEKHNASGQAEAFKGSAVAVYVHPDQRLLHFNATRVYFESTADDALAAALDMSRVETEARKGILPTGRAAEAGGGRLR